MTDGKPRGKWREFINLREDPLERDFPTTTHIEYLNRNPKDREKKKARRRMANKSKSRNRK